MQELADEYRGHMIITHVSGPSLTVGPWIASYSAWKTSPDHSYCAVVNGALKQVFQTTESARSAATIEAKERLDDILDGV